MTSLHDDFVSFDLDAIDSFVVARRQEDLHLDFKELMRSPDFDKPDKKNLAKAISGFANSDGGLIVWGVEARKDVDGVDAASAKKPIRRVDVAHSKLLSLTGEAAGPIVDGVEHRVVHEGVDDGYIVTYVPRSDSGPHMARLGEGRYYKRSGDSFYPLEHFDLEDMFGRRPKPKLEVTARARRGNYASLRGTEIEIFVGIRNTGRGIARFPYFKLQTFEPYVWNQYGLDDNSSHGLPVAPMMLGVESTIRFYGGANSVIHPGDELVVTRLTGRATEITQPAEVRFLYQLGADGIAESAGTKRMSAEEIAESILR